MDSLQDLVNLRQQIERIKSLLEIIKKSGFGEANSSVDDGLGTDALSSFQVETVEGESQEGDMFDDAEKVKEQKPEKQLLEEEREPNGQIERDSSVGAKFLLFIALPAV